MVLSKMKKISGGINAVRGFKSAGINCGIKGNGKKDLLLVLSEKLASAAGVFTTNRVRASSVIETIKRVKNGIAKAIIANSGNANACTGKKGEETTLEIIEFTGKNLKISGENILVASTGIIGRLPEVDKIRKGVMRLMKKIDSGDLSGAADAIMTTDTFSKEIAIEIELKNSNIRIAGIAKGAGMVCPNMATMLAFIVTDATIKKNILQKALKEAVDKSFNMITIDGCMSTNDMVLLLANGMSDSQEIKKGSNELRLFKAGLDFVAGKLAKMIVLDGEGATKLIKISVLGAKTKKSAKNAAMAIANSNLVKTAFFGEILNWGRITAALGASGIEFSPEKIDIYFSGKKIVNKGCGCGFNEKEIKKILKNKEITIEVSLNNGNKEAIVLTSDLSCEYIRINASYN
ncbi:MAG: bifunctional ornithine acetyltransferase/N-acetylglutamate synthase [Candidatus Schekmanbacteria bacterium RIFCSPHIGHO2_02_FULL_38_11]|uniref:Arginine biosynthesis bifunctional protein ArgJ n=1 Tax=Candidatus Schekmanbacteria bacterium RIFCSPLOWO2_12_FULL_38_15 TaxID=1817883 RepID=A0A1F7SI20_9BACT|nr:MAG: bifunctional ornithine acetyltransferase/N-acetylglutamate synthase [Candidatus Schekmanbacteria bacterium GWA2_38_9]OGL50807.1 MAG: bifunctional ornithine acetyltransferase/N-acetylglutamate synthase [Candidatus Schekmanbacteria bacterium RIFCSPLOWO2_02_FULL_38_14]OGL53432.1 MAG: bifunctional ornithine acetyltransferase/N-acetylglutamate synthase [Candidatus Schekmanbacteria bacterium RIFCSPLOWO2_12_FULL_38_15]OGL55051.1 MAG: bifunctional ornithine acetyltransferase/N-acetylglutamate sy